MTFRTASIAESIDEEFGTAKTDPSMISCSIIQNQSQNEANQF